LTNEGVVHIDYVTFNTLPNYTQDAFTQIPGVNLLEKKTEEQLASAFYF